MAAKRYIHFVHVPSCIYVQNSTMWSNVFLTTRITFVLGLSRNIQFANVQGVSGASRDFPLKSAPKWPKNISCLLMAGNTIHSCSIERWLERSIPRREWALPPRFRENQRHWYLPTVRVRTNTQLDLTICCWSKLDRFVIWMRLFGLCDLIWHI